MDATPSTRSVPRLRHHMLSAVVRSGRSAVAVLGLLGVMSALVAGVPGVEGWRTSHPGPRSDVWPSGRGPTSGSGDVHGGGLASPSRAPPGTARAIVRRVVDGDTLIAVVRGRPVRVRLIGVDAPERAECYGARATRELRRLAPASARIGLASDRRIHDSYGRELRYVWTPRHGLVNRALVLSGSARSMAIFPNDRFRAVLRRAERLARRARAGLWHACAHGAWGWASD